MTLAIPELALPSPRPAPDLPQPAPMPPCPALPCPALPSPAAQPIDLLDDAPDAWKTAAEQHDPDCTVIVFCNPALLRTTLSFLSNTAYVKLCGEHE